MKKCLVVLVFCFSSCFLFQVNAQALETFHDFTAVKINGDTMDLSILAGKKVLVVNTASYCGFTPQYDDLETLYSQYGGGTNFEILGFPCNDFGNQEPHDDSTINVFCNNYNVTFQMMSKISITAPDTAEVYKWLQLLSRNGVADAPVNWNFNKYLVDEAGHWVAHFVGGVNPLDPVIVNWLTTTSVNEIGSQNNTFSVFPNPAKNEITVNNNLFEDKCVLKVYDSFGRNVFQSSFNNYQSPIKIDVSGIAAGVYSVQLISENGVFQTKLIKQ
ncbi:MAG: T9SS type A sorting domain-containing protein [Bacteroidia bacterium]